MPLHDAVVTILDALCSRCPGAVPARAQIEQAFLVMSESFACGGCLYVCGNGGSAADAEHIVGELMKSFIVGRRMSSSEQERLRREGEDGAYLASSLVPGLRATALTGHPSLATALSNDVANDVVFAQQLFVLGKKGDVLLGLSTSGNARNVILAGLVARMRGIKWIGLTGKSGGRLRQMADLCICVAENETFKIQESHLPVYHALCAMLEVHFFAADGG